MADVEIVTKMIDETSQQAEKIGTNLKRTREFTDEFRNSSDKARATSEKLGKAIGGSADTLDKLKGGLSQTIEGLTGFNLAQVSAAAAVTMAVNETRKAIDEYSSYVEQVDKVSMATGMAADETSRLIQVADDARVGTAALENGMKLALQNGFVPTVENLATLSDRYLEIQDPAQRAAEMQKVFGRSWSELVPLLEQGGDKIREASEEMSGSLVVTQQAIIQNRLYQKSLDDWGDTIQEIKFGFVNDLLPPLTDSINALLRAPEALEENKVGWLNLVPPLMYAKIAYDEINKAGAERRKETEELAKEVKKETEGYKFLADATGEVTQEMQKYADMVNDAAAAQDHWRGVADDSWKEADRMSRQLEQIHGGMSTSIVDTWDAIHASEGYKSALENLRGAQEGLATASANFNQSYGDQVVAKLKEAGISGDLLVSVYGELDEKLGSNYVAQDKANKALDDAIKNLGKTRDVDAFGEALEGNKSSWEKLDEGIQKAKLSLENAQTAWQNFIQRVGEANGLRVTIYADVVRTGGSSSQSNADSRAGRGENYDEGLNGGATGLSMVVPPGYSEAGGRPFLFEAESGEHVNISTAGTPSRGGAGMVIEKLEVNVNGAGNPAAVADEVVRRISREVSMASRAGFGSAGR